MSQRLFRGIKSTKTETPEVQSIKTESKLDLIFSSNNPCSIENNTFEKKMQKSDSVFQFSKNCSENTSSITKMTKFHNEIIASSLEKFFKEKRPLEVLPKIETKSLLHKEADFLKLLNRLDKIILPNRSQKLIVFQEYDPVEFSIEENLTQYCKIHVKKHKSPMIVKISKMKGKIITFISTTEEEPGVNNCERCYRTDTFEIKENGNYFKTENVFFGIKALEDCSLKVLITFGKTTEI